PAHPACCAGGDKRPGTAPPCAVQQPSETGPEPVAPCKSPFECRTFDGRRAIGWREVSPVFLRRRARSVKRLRESAVRRPAGRLEWQGRWIGCCLASNPSYKFSVRTLGGDKAAVDQDQLPVISDQGQA